MNVIKFNPRYESKIAFCCVDTIHTYTSQWTREIMKNISDYNISNISDKGYTVFVSQYEDKMLSDVSDLGFTHAVVYSTGTEFINGEECFTAFKSLCEKDFFLAGHILDRKDAYYELHSQCYVVNLTRYNEFRKPTVGKQQLGKSHKQVEPLRSTDNIHDDYTPTWIRSGNTVKDYMHQAHGWNILKTAFDNKVEVLVFDSSIRDNKKHYYPESPEDFKQHSQWLYYRQTVCQNNFIHTTSNEYPPDLKEKFTQVFSPASGSWWKDYLAEGPVDVVLYDYNQRALDYWKEHAPAFDNVTYQFVLLDLLSIEVDVSLYLKKNKKTLINLSNIFCYEGTSAFAPLTHRLYMENHLIKNIQMHFPDCYLYFCGRTATGFIDLKYLGLAKDFETYELFQLTVPSWHQAGDWCV